MSIPRLGIVSSLVGAAGAAAGGYAGGKLGKAIGGRKGKIVGRVAGSIIGGHFGAAGGMLIPVIGSFKKGGKVKRTGAYILHKGEHVVPVRKKKRKRG